MMSWGRIAYAHVKMNIRGYMSYYTGVGNTPLRWVKIKTGGSKITIKNP